MPKREREMSLLDRFVLFLVRDGVGTLYELKQIGGLSIGAASPSLRRLQKMLCVNPGKPGVRGKRKYQLGIFAYREFESDRLTRLDESSLPTDTESIARIVAIAGEDDKLRPIAVAALTKAIAQRRRRLDRPVSEPSKSRIADRYRSVLYSCETARLKAEVAALRKIKASLK